MLLPGLPTLNLPALEAIAAVHAANARRIDRNDSVSPTPFEGSAKRDRPRGLPACNGICCSKGARSATAPAACQRATGFAVRREREARPPPRPASVQRDLLFEGSAKRDRRTPNPF